MSTRRIPARRQRRVPRAARARHTSIGRPRLSERRAATRAGARQAHRRVFVMFARRMSRLRAGSRAHATKRLTCTTRLTLVWRARRAFDSAQRHKTRHKPGTKRTPSPVCERSDAHESRCCWRGVFRAGSRVHRVRRAHAPLQHHERAQLDAHCSVRRRSRVSCCAASPPPLRGAQRGANCHPRAPRFCSSPAEAAPHRITAREKSAADST